MLILSATPFDIDDTARITNPGVFIDKLNSIIEGNFYETEYLQNPLRYPPIEFLGGDASSMAFSNVDGKVFINFRLQGYAGNDVLIKWYNPTTGKILGFKKHNIEPSHTNHPIWLENRSDWESGQYNVEIYSTDESLQLITAGVYQVTDI